MRIEAMDKMKTRAKIGGIAMLLLPVSITLSDAGVQAEPLRMPPAGDDAQISRRAERELSADHAVPSDRVRISASEGILTLSGTVDTLGAKKRAVKVARVVRGVRCVIDRLEVTPASRPDGEIREGVILALARDPAADLSPGYLPILILTSPGHRPSPDSASSRAAPPAPPRSPRSGRAAHPADR